MSQHERQQSLLWKAEPIRLTSTAVFWHYNNFLVDLEYFAVNSDLTGLKTTSNHVLVRKQRCEPVGREKWETLTAGVRTVSDRDSPSRSVTRLLDRKVLTGVTCGDGVGSTERRHRKIQWGLFYLCFLVRICFLFFSSLINRRLTEHRKQSAAPTVAGIFRNSSAMKWKDSQSSRSSRDISFLSFLLSFLTSLEGGLDSAAWRQMKEKWVGEDFCVTVLKQRRLNIGVL